MEKNEHYVYMVIDKETFDVKYIGKGKGKRCYNILSGVSNNYEANKAHHTGTASNCEVYEVYTDLSNSLALTIEKAMIYTIQPEWNSDHINIMPDVDIEYFMVGWRIKYLMEQFKNGMWKNTPDRVRFIFGLTRVMWCDTIEEFTEYVSHAWGDQDHKFIKTICVLWSVCDDLAKDESSYHF